MRYFNKFKQFKENLNSIRIMNKIMERNNFPFLFLFHYLKKNIGLFKLIQRTQQISRFKMYIILHYIWRKSKAIFVQSFQWFLENGCENKHSLGYAPIIHLYLKEIKSSEEKDTFFKKLIENDIKVSNKIKIEYFIYFEIDEKTGENLYFET